MAACVVMLQQNLIKAIFYATARANNIVSRQVVYEIGGREKSWEVEQ